MVGEQALRARTETREISWVINFTEIITQHRAFLDFSIVRVLDLRGKIRCRDGGEFGRAECSEFALVSDRSL